MPTLLAAQAWRDFLSAGGAADAELRPIVATVAMQAPSLLPLLLQDVELPRAVLHKPLSEAATAAELQRRFFASVGEQHDGVETRRILRRLRHREVVRIALREVLGLGDVDATSAELAALAAAAVDAALASCRRSVETEHGEVVDLQGQRVPLVVLGMGKLGGNELNFGSDIDLCFFYGTDEAEIRRKDSGALSEMTPNRFFSLVAARTSQALAEITELGFCFRVDLRLRPEGTQGALVNSMASAEHYYEAWGRTWERAALLRARPIAGDLAFGDELLRSLRPFVYRRRVDPSIATQLEQMLATTRRQQSGGVERDIKLGPGGIREAEFFVQALQLIWGGVQTQLQVSGTLEALRRLRLAGLVSDREAVEIESAWVLLRRLEHRIHMQAGYQTHRLPERQADLTALATSLGFADAAALLQALAAARSAVSATFAGLLPDANVHAATGSVYDKLCDALAAGVSAAEVAELVVQALPVHDPDEATAHLLRMAKRAKSPLSAASRQRLPDFGVALLREVAETVHPEAALRHLADFFQTLGDPWSYDRLLAEQPTLRRRLVSLFGSSNTLATALIHHPESLDRMLTQVRLADAAALGAAHAELLPDAAQDLPDAEEWTAGLRTLKREFTLQTGLAYLAGEVDLAGLEQHLTQLAEAQIGAALGYAERVLQLPQPSSFAVVGLGKLGSAQMGFGADLDLAFFYDEAEAEHSEALTRLAQLTLRLLSRPHPAGPGYPTDTRLRPEGAHGLLISSLGAFERYHAGKAAFWERQALLRARPVAGPPAFCERLARQLQNCAYQQAPSFADFAAMRRRIELEIGAERRGRYHVKYGFGALLDVEFVAQGLQMQHGDNPLLRLRHPLLAVQALAAAGHLSEAELSLLRQGYGFFRRAEQALRLLDDGREPMWSEGGPVELHLTRALGLRARGAITAPEVLRQRWRSLTTAVRVLFDERIAAVGTSPWWEV